MKKPTSKRAVTKKRRQRVPKHSVPVPLGMVSPESIKSLHKGLNRPYLYASYRTPSKDRERIILERDEQISALINTHNKNGYVAIEIADKVANPYILRRPTNIIELDIDLGGGFPAGGVSMISGVDNSGKTWLLFKTMAMQQRIYGNDCRLAYAMSEGAFPFDQAINAGMKIAIPDSIIHQWNQWRALRGIPPYTDEEVANFKQQIGQLHIFRGSTGEEILGLILKAVATKAYSVIGCDSLNGLLPGADASKDLDQSTKKAAHAFMIDNFFRHYIPMTTGLNGINETTLIFTQQVRANQERAFAPSYKQAYIKPYVVAGSYAAKHYKLIDLVIDDRPLRKGEREDRHVVGKIISWYLDKAKAGTHDNKSGEVAYYYGLHGTDDVGELIASAIKRGILQQRGAQWVVVRPDTLEVREEFTAPNQKMLRKMLEVDQAFEMALRFEVLTAAGVKCLYDLESD